MEYSRRYRNFLICICSLCLVSVSVSLGAIVPTPFGGNFQPMPKPISKNCFQRPLQYAQAQSGSQFQKSNQNPVAQPQPNIIFYEFPNFMLPSPGSKFIESETEPKILIYVKPPLITHSYHFYREEDKDDPPPAPRIHFLQDEKFPRNQNKISRISSGPKSTTHLDMRAETNSRKLVRETPKEIRRNGNTPNNFEIIKSIPAMYSYSYHFEKDFS